MKVGLFGGSFNPPHLGHVNSLQSISRKLGLSKVFVIPNVQNPLKTQVEGPTPEQRLKMAELMISDLGDVFEIDAQEVKRGGTSYTIETILNYRKKYEPKDLFLIIGMDNFENFSEWKDYKKILKECNLVVTTRPGYILPDESDPLPAFLEELVEEREFNFVELKNGNSIQFVSLEDVETSSSELRKMIRTSKSVRQFLPLSVENFIKENNLYRPMGDKIGNFKKFTEFCAQVLFDRKGVNVQGYDLTMMTAPSEYTLIASGTNTRHTVALSEHVIQAVKEEYGVYPQAIEGVDEGRWVVIDYGSLLVHIFYDFVRNEYNLENLWKSGKDLGLKDKAASTPSK